MRSLFIISFFGCALLSCNQKDKQTGSKKADKKNENSAYTISKDGIGELKIGMTQAELEKLLNQKLVMMHANDSGEVWSDTAMVKYKEIDVSLYFERMYSEQQSREMQLTGVGTSSSLCKTAKGIGIGDDRSAILAAYEDNPVNMGPESELVNDTTWVLSKTKYYIHVKDEMWDKEVIFKLLNKKVTSIHATIVMGD